MTETDLTLPDTARITPSVPAVAVIMRTKDRPLLLGRAMDSVLGQSFGDWHLVIVNDGGEPGPVDLLVAQRADAFAGRVSVLHHERSLGMEAASNRGLCAVDSRYVVIHDDDDSWGGDFLKECVGFLEAEGDRYHGVVTRIQRINEEIDGSEVREVGREDFNEPFGTHRLTLHAMVTHNQFPPIGFLYRRAVFDAIGMYREDLPVLGDWEFNLRFASRFAIGFVNRKLAFWHIRPGTGSLANTVTAQQDHHIKQEELLRSELLRTDLAQNRVGIGWLTNIRFLVHSTLEHEREMARLQQAEQTLRAHIGYLEGVIAQATRERDEAVQQRDELRLRVGGLEGDVKSLSCQLKNIQKSLSWKLTRPLRLARAIYQKRRGGALRVGTDTP